MMYAARSVARFILPIWAAALQTVFAGRYYDHPTPWCKNCLAIAVHDAPGIGFDLTTSYGTAVAHLYNGTIVDIAKVPASSDYQALISRLHNTAPPASPSRLERLQRWWNKYRGLPATPEVGILASLLSSLKSTTSAALSTSPITHVAITHPPIPALFTSLNLADAFLHAGLQHNWLGDARGMQPKHISQSHATLAGNGMGLCESYTDLLRCWGEGAEMPERWVLYASLTRHVLDVRVEKMGDAFQRWVRMKDGVVVLDFDAGLEWKGKGKFKGEGEYWAHVRRRIKGALKGGWVVGVPEMVLLGGENATESAFLAALRDALAEARVGLPGQGPVVLLDSKAVADPTFAAARGMAVYARRRQEVPRDCREIPKCEERREEERRGGDRQAGTTVIS